MIAYFRWCAVISSELTVDGIMEDRRNRTREDNRGFVSYDDGVMSTRKRRDELHRNADVSEDGKEYQSGRAQPFVYNLVLQNRC